MIFSGVRLPDELRIALERGELVVFAGAGISVPPPSSLPSFDNLVREIAGMNEKESVVNPDQILGGLVAKNIKVHEAVAKRLLTNTKPTELHKEILRLFGDPARVRVVTTNFDNHFTDAALEVYPGQGVTEYHAPALPLGDDFEGVVYLHGCARVKPLSQVLTDKDFGMAYLTRGWARDFLIALFSRYTVAFVGYSHNDIVVSYLARGMSPAELKPRWVFVPADKETQEQDRWRHLEIRTVSYPRDPDHKENKHQPLTDFFTAWVKHQRLTLIDHSAAAVTLASGLPPEGDAAAEYIKYCLAEQRLAQDFCNAIKHPAWVGWIEKQGLLKSFFTHSAESDVRLKSEDFVLAHWLATFVRKNHPEVLLSILERNHGVMSGAFAGKLGHAVFSDDTSQMDPHYAVWLSLLLSKGEGCLDRQIWAYLLNKCRIPDHTMVALRILELLSRPSIRLEKYFEFRAASGETEEKKDDPFSGKQVDFRVAWPNPESHWVEQAWRDVIKPNLPALSEQLALLATKQILDAHYLLRGLGKAGSQFDTMSWSISSVAPHEQNERPLYGILSFLINVLREVLDHWLTTARERAIGQMAIWWNSSVPLLRRLVIYGVSKDVGRSADEKLNWLLDNDLIFTFGLKKEVFDVLAAAYPHATDPVRKAIVERVEVGHKGASAEKLDYDTIAYESFNVLEWLRRAKPDCAFMQEAMARSSKAHPDFAAREHPDFDHWHGSVGFVDPKDGFDFEKILAEPPENYLAALIGSAEASLRKDRWSYLSNLRVLFGRDRKWAEGFIQACASQGIDDRGIWNSVFSSWNEILKTVADWGWMVSLIESLPKTAIIYGNAVYPLDHGLWSDELAAPLDLANRGLAISLTAWELTRAAVERLDSTHQEWLTSAINHPGGWIGRCWIQHCSYLKRHKEPIPATVRNAIIEALQGTDAVSVYARISITPFVAYLYVWDAALVKDHFLPLYDWSRDRVAAQQTWSVVLSYERGRNQEWEKMLIPYYKGLVKEMSVLLRQAAGEQSQFDSHALQSLGWHLANLAMRAYENPLAEGFFHEFLPLLPEGVRGAFADAMGEYLKNLEPAEREKIWKAWLKEYLEKRVLGIPISIAHEEANEFAEWCIDFGDLFSEIVDLVVKMPVEEIWVNRFSEELEKGPLVEQFPNAACDYLVLLLKAEKYPMLPAGLKSLHERLKILIPSSPNLRALEEEMYKRGLKP